MCPDEKSSYILFSFSFSPFSSKLNTWGIKIGQGSYEKKKATVEYSAFMRWTH